MSDKENQKQCTQKFIALANELKDQGQDPKLVSSALMMASGIYVTYVAAGNEGGLEPSGVDKVVAFYRRNLEHIQESKKAAKKAAGKAENK